MKRNPKPSQTLSSDRLREVCKAAAAVFEALGPLTADERALVVRATQILFEIEP